MKRVRLRCLIAHVLSKCKSCCSGQMGTYFSENQWGIEMLGQVLSAQVLLHSSMLILNHSVGKIGL